MKKLLTLLTLLCSLSHFSQESKPSFETKEIAINEFLNGSLTSDLKKQKNLNLTILIAGSGPTDRNGNQNGMENNSLKFLAEGIVTVKNDVFRFDKKMFGLAKAGKLNEKDLSFDDMITDVKLIIDYFKAQKKYQKIIIAGHSEGSLVGMIAALGNADAFISIAGPGRPANEIIEEQIGKQAPTMLAEIKENFEKLKNGQTFESKNPMLASLFRESVQPYLISWIKYNPQTEIKKLNIPILILNGTKDIQVGVSDAELLKTAKPEAKLVIIENMNHVLKTIVGDQAENMASYTNSQLPVNLDFLKSVNDFINKL